MKLLFAIGRSAFEVLCVAAMCWGSPAIAAAQDSRFSTSPDGTRIQFDIRNVARREVLDRLISDRGITIEWRDAAVGDEPITGTFNGTFASVSRQLLAPTDFVVMYDLSASEPRMSRVLVIGRAGRRSASGSKVVQQLALIPGPVPAPAQAPGLTPMAAPRAPARAATPLVSQAPEAIQELAPTAGPDPGAVSATAPVPRPDRLH